MQILLATKILIDNSTMLIKFESLFTRYKGQNPKTAFAFFRYPLVETWEKPFEELARLAKPEQWGFERSEFKEQKYSNQRFPILTNYLNYTFLRVQELGLIAYSEDEDKACFNTGLLTPEENCKERVVILQQSLLPSQEHI